MTLNMACGQFRPGDVTSGLPSSMAGRSSTKRLLSKTSVMRGIKATREKRGSSKILTMPNRAERNLCSTVNLSVTILANSRVRKTSRCS